MFFYSSVNMCMFLYSPLNMYILLFFSNLLQVNLLPQFHQMSYQVSRSWRFAFLRLINVFARFFSIFEQIEPSFPLNLCLIYVKRWCIGLGIHAFVIAAVILGRLNITRLYLFYFSFSHAVTDRNYSAQYSE